MCHLSDNVANQPVQGVDGWLAAGVIAIWLVLGETPALSGTVAVRHIKFSVVIP